MNLVVDCMQVLSGRPLNYFLERQREFPLTLFKRCLERTAATAYRKRLNEIYSYVEAHNDSLGLWRNCEVYHPIDYLLHARDEEYFPYLIELFQVLVGMKDIREAKKLPDGYYRLSHLTGRVYEKRNGKLSEISKSVVGKIDDFKPVIYFPKNELFRDVLVGRLYPDMNGSFGPARLKSQLARTLAHMKGFSRDIWDDFQEAISTVVLLTSSARVPSLAATYKYFGGVFFNCFMNDEYKGVESLVHEYIHNRCTLWWESATPSGIPADRVRIVSPVSGNEVMASTMVHAFIIYLSALQFYRYVQTTRMPSDQSAGARLNRRAHHISRGMPLLYRSLRRVVRRGTDIERLLNYLMEVYEPLRLK